MGKNKNIEIRSIAEFEQKYYPRHYKEQSMEKIEDPIELGIHMANESLEKIHRIFK